MEKGIFNMYIPGKAVFGPGSINLLPSTLKSLGVERPFIITDKNIQTIGHINKIKEILTKEDITVCGIFDGVEPEPSVETTDKATEIAKKTECDSIIGVGGGSCLDVAKAVSVLITNPGSAADYQGLGLVKNKGLPKIMIPTTAGTGSEVTFTAVLIRRKDGVKGGINDPKLFPEACILDPLLTVSMPPNITAATGMDALTHALEAFVSKQASPFSDMFAVKALNMISRWLRVATYNPNNIEARGNMLLASYYGGIALANAGVGLCHSLAYPLGSMFNVPHGVANALLIPYVVKFNAFASPQKYSLVAKILDSSISNSLSLWDKAQACSILLQELIEDLSLPVKLKDLNIPIKKEDIPKMAEKAMNVKRPIENNPRPVSKEDCIKIYIEALE